MFFQLFTPLQFVRIKFEKKLPLLAVFPSVVAIFPTYLHWTTSIDFNLYGGGGVVEALNSLLPIMIGFYVAALAAVATMDREMLDEEIQGSQVTLRRMYQGKQITENLTRRRFLCYMFGYLSFMCIVSYILGSFGQVGSEIISKFACQDLREIFSATAIFAYFFLYSNLIITTMFGLHYLSERIHRSD